MKKIKSIVESILLAKGVPIGLKQIAEIIEVEKPQVELAVEELAQNYKNQKSGLAIIKNSGKVQLVTVAENAEYIEKILKNDLQKSLTIAALEVLSIVAYQGPVSNVDIEAIRGVNSAFTLRSLLMKGLISREVDSENQRGYLYKISFEFIKKLGLESVENLPDYKKLSKDDRIKSIIKIHSES